jgi:hypothetical protein
MSGHAGVTPVVVAGGLVVLAGLGFFAVNVLVTVGRA